MITSLALYFTYVIHGMAGQIGEGGNMHKYPVAIVAGVGLLLLISFSDKYQEKRKDSKVCARTGNRDRKKLRVQKSKAKYR